VPLGKTRVPKDPREKVILTDPGPTEHQEKSNQVAHFQSLKKLKAVPDEMRKRRKEEQFPHGVGEPRRSHTKGGHTTTTNRGGGGKKGQNGPSAPSLPGPFGGNEGKKKICGEITEGEKKQ